MLDSKLSFVAVSAFVFWRFGSVVTLNVWFIMLLVNFLVPGFGSDRDKVAARLKLFFYPVVFILKVGVQTMLCLVTWPPVNVVMFRDIQLPWVFETPFAKQ